MVAMNAQYATLVSSTPRYRKSTEGIALVVVLWAIVLLSSMAVAVSAIQRTDIDLVKNLLNSAQARAQAQAGIYYAASRVGVGSLEDETWEADGVSHEWSFDGVKMRLRILDERSRVDLNFASAELLEGLLRSVGVDEESLLSVRDAIVDWRDRDNLRQLDGAEDDDYAAFEMGYGAKDGNFDSVDELQLVMGVTPEVFTALAPHLTVYSRSPSVSPVAAHRDVLHALPGSTDESVDAYIAERNALLEQNLPMSTLPAVGSGATAGGRTNVVRIICEVHSEQTRRPFTWGAVVNTASARSQGPQVLAWLMRVPLDDRQNEARPDE